MTTRREDAFLRDELQRFDALHPNASVEETASYVEALRSTMIYKNAMFLDACESLWTRTPLVKLWRR